MCFSELSCFWEQKKSRTASLKRLVGIKLEGLEIEWTNSALSCYLWLSRAPAGCSPQQNAALGCVKGAQTTAHPLSGFDLSTQDGGLSTQLGSGWFRMWVTDGSREGESGPWSAVFCSLRCLFALQSLSYHQPPNETCWQLQLTDYCLTSEIKLVLKRDLAAKGAQQPGLSGDGTPEAPLSDGWQSGLLCSPGRKSLVNDRN